MKKKNVFVDADMFELKTSMQTMVDCLGDSTQNMVVILEKGQKGLYRMMTRGWKQPMTFLQFILDQESTYIILRLNEV